MSAAEQWDGWDDALEPPPAEDDQGWRGTPELESETGPTATLRAALLSTDQIMALEPPPSLIDGLLYRDSLAVLYGPSGLGKSFLAIDWAMHVANGAWWQRNETHGGPVLYVVAEGASGTGIRLEAWRAHNRTPHDVHPVAWLPMAVPLHSDAWAAALAEVVSELAPALVVVDTLARSMVGAEENSAKDMGQVVHNLDLVRRAAACCVLLVHHSGKDIGAGSRGSSALRGAVDTELELSGETTNMRLKNPKQKHAAEANPVKLALRPVEGTKSAVIAAWAVDPEHMNDTDLRVLQVLREVDVPEGVSSTDWRESSGETKPTFMRARARLVEGGLVSDVSKGSRPAYRPVTRENVT